MNISPGIRAVLEWHRSTASFLREALATCCVHSDGTSRVVMIRQIVIIEQFLGIPLLSSNDICIGYVYLALKLLILLNFVLLFQGWIHIWLYWLLAITSWLKDLSLVLLLLLLLLCEGVKLAWVLCVVIRKSQHVILWKLLTWLGFERLLGWRKRVLRHATYALTLDLVGCSSTYSSCRRIDDVLNRIWLNYLIPFWVINILFLGWFL